MKNNPKLMRSTSDDRGIAAMTHLLPYITSILGPIAVFVISKKKFVKENAKQVINFHLSMLLYAMALFFIGIGLFVSLALIILIPIVIGAGIGIVLASLILPVVGAVKASEGEVYKYPLALTFLS